MIPLIKRFLLDRGHLPAGYTGDVNIFLGRNTLLQFFLPREQSIIVKVAEIKDENSASLAREKAALEENWPRYPDLVPKVITAEKSGDYYLLCVEGTRITTTRLEDIFRLKGPQFHQMQRLLCGEDRIAATPKNVALSGQEQFRNACTLLPQDMYQSYERLGKLRLWDHMIATLPSIPQHGDLAINNIGKSRQGIIVFDWEDYGQITVPGFDLCVLLFSGTRFQMKELKGIINGIYKEKSREAYFLKEVVARLNVDHALINDFLMIHLILFHGLKHSLGYGTEVIQNCQKLMGELISNPIV